MKRVHLLVAGWVVVAASCAAQPASRQRAPGSGKDAAGTPAAGFSATCAGLFAWIGGELQSLHGSNISAVAAAIAKERPPQFDCSTMPRLAGGVRLQLSRAFYDRPHQSWQFFLRCVNAGDCVPFVVRLPEEVRQTDQRLSKTDVNFSAAPSRSALTHSGNDRGYLLRPGAAVTLLWDGGGIRVVVPAICLDRGNVGESVRVRTQTGGILRAEIVNESLVRPVL